MAGKTVILTRETEFVIRKMGNRIKEARLRRNIKAEILAEHVGISKGTLSAIEKGELTVSIGAYAAILNALDMINDFDYVAVDREGKQCYQNSHLYHRKRASKRKEGGERKFASN